VLASVPALHPNVERIVEKRYGCTLQWDLSEEQSKRPKRSWFPKFFFNPNRKRRHKLVLDDMGRRTVELIDGKRTVADIAAEMAKQVGCDKKAMQEAILTFVAQLARRNVVTLAPH
ncbi:MAG: PqqD family peptide modification chaperone, partial [Kiritimatiellae bacterium]|nr:PqqD family peptide modification chaperone [Kiritimatiellia bacterium]